MTDTTVSVSVNATEVKEWAEKFADAGKHGLAAVLYAFLDRPEKVAPTVDSPAPTLAEELREEASWADGLGGPVHGAKFRALADRAEQMEHDLAEARAERDRLGADRGAYERMYIESRTEATALAEDLAGAESEVERLTAERDEKEVLDAIDAHYDHYAVQKGAESNAESPDPADVKPGEAWIVEVEGGRRTAVKDSDAGVPWSTVNNSGVFHAENDDDVTLISRLVPAPRVIANLAELDRAKRLTVIRDGVGVVCERASLGDGWFTTLTGTDQTSYIQFPATVLWEPEA